jgi:hypothetical protein
MSDSAADIPLDPIPVPPAVTTDDVSSFSDPTDLNEFPSEVSTILGLKKCTKDSVLSIRSTIRALEDTVISQDIQLNLQRDLIDQLQLQLNQMQLLLLQLTGSSHGFLAHSQSPYHDVDRMLHLQELARLKFTIDNTDFIHFFESIRKYEHYIDACKDRNVVPDSLHSFLGPDLKASVNDRAKKSVPVCDLKSLCHEDYVSFLLSHRHLTDPDKIKLYFEQLLHSFRLAYGEPELSESYVLLYSRAYRLILQYVGPSALPPVRNEIIKNFISYTYKKHLHPDLRQNILQITSTKDSLDDVIDKTIEYRVSVYNSVSLTSSVGHQTKPSSPSKTANVVQSPSPNGPCCFACKSPDHMAYDCSNVCTYPSCSKLPKHNGKDCETIKRILIEYAKKKANSICKSSNQPTSTKSPKTSHFAAIDSAANGVFLRSSDPISHLTPYVSSDNRRRITVGNGAVILAEAHGTLGTTSISADYTPDLSMNLLGLSPMMQAGMIGIVDKNKFLIVKGTPQILNELAKVITAATNSNDLILSAPQHNGLYVTDLSTFSSSSMTSSMTSSDKLIRIAASAIRLNTTLLNNVQDIIRYVHEIMNHPSLQIMLDIADHKSILGLPTEFNRANILKYFPHTCHACALGNMAQTPLQPKLSRSITYNCCGECVQIDIIGPMDNKELPLGMNQIRYILNVVDIFSDFCLTYRLKSRKNLLHYIQQIVLFFKSHGHPIKRFEFDDEFNQVLIRNFLSESNITWEACLPHEHSSIGNIERKNRTLQETVIKLLNCPRITDKAVWPFAFSHAAFTDSIRPKKRLQDKSSYELFFGQVFDISRTPLLPFMCDVAAHIPVHLQGKLGNKSMICKSLGSSFETNGGTRLLTPNKREIIRRSYKSLHQEDNPDVTSLVDFTCDLLENTTEDDVIVSAILRDSATPATDPTTAPPTIRKVKQPRKISPKVVSIPIAVPDVITQIIAPEIPAVELPIEAILPAQDPIIGKSKKQKKKKKKIAPVDPVDIPPPPPPLRRYKKDPVLKPGSTRVFINDNNKTTIIGSSQSVRPTRQLKKVEVRIKPTETGTYAKYYPPKHAHLSCKHPNCSISSIFPHYSQTFVSPHQKYCMAATSANSITEDDEQLPSEIHTIPIPRSLSTIPDNEYAAQWFQAAKDEFSSLWSLGTFEEVSVTDIIKSKTIPSKLIFDIRRNADGSIKKFKARLVARGDLQPWETYNDTFADTIDSKSINIIFAIAAQENMHLASIDIKTAFLYSPMQEEVYLRRPKGVTDDLMPEYVKLNKCLYGLKQAAHEWKSHLHNSLLDLGFTQCPSDHCVYIKKSQHDSIIIGTHVDDGLIAATKESLINDFLAQINEKYEITINNPLTHYLNRVIVQDRANKTITISQPGYIDKLKVAFPPQTSNLPSTPMLPHRDNIDKSPILLLPSRRNIYMQKVGSLNYLAVNTRPDIAFAVGWVARKMQQPTEYDMLQVDRIINYVINTKDYGLTFRGKGGVVLSVYVDASYAIHDDRKSHFGTCMFIGDFSASVATKSRKAKCMAISSTEAEYLALCEGAKLVAWARQLLSELGYPQPGPTVVYEDNQATIKMVNNGNDKGRTKHIDVRFHYIREMIEQGQIKMEYKRTEDMVADILTKASEKSVFDKLRPVLLGLSPDEFKVSLLVLRDVFTSKEGVARHP